MNIEGIKGIAVDQGVPRPTHSDKYMTFKTEELFELMGALAMPNSDTLKWTGDTDCAEVAERLQKALHECALHDAVVIRTGDVFAGPALHGYAASIGVTISVLKDVIWPGRSPQAESLQPIADYLSERAVEADEIAAAGNAHLPD